MLAQHLSHCKLWTVHTTSAPYLRFAFTTSKCLCVVFQPVLQPAILWALWMQKPALQVRKKPQERAMRPWERVGAGERPKGDKWSVLPTWLQPWTWPFSSCRWESCLWVWLLLLHSTFPSMPGSGVFQQSQEIVLAGKRKGILETERNTWCSYQRGRLCLSRVHWGYKICFLLGLQ